MSNAQSTKQIRSVQDNVPLYTTDPQGSRGGLPGWTRIFRNGQVVHYQPTDQEAQRWITTARVSP